MATYEYKCDTDDRVQAISRTFDERDNLVNCATCGGQMRRIFSAPGITFNGPGFYKTGG